MDALTLTTACILCVAQPATAPNIARWEPLIAEASARFAIPEAWIKGVMRVESAGLTTLDGEPITSAAGAMGLMQIMPNTYAELQKQYGFGADPYDPHDNILAGAAYLKAMYARYGYPLLFAAYLTGPTHLNHYLSSPEDLPQNVIAYVNGIASNAIPGQEISSERPKSKSEKTRNRVSSGLFFVLKPALKSPPTRSNDAPDIRATEPKSVFVGADRPTNLFVSLSSHDR